MTQTISGTVDSDELVKRAVPVMIVDVSAGEYIDAAFTDDNGNYSTEVPDSAHTYMVVPMHQGHDGEWYTDRPVNGNDGSVGPLDIGNFDSGSLDGWETDTNHSLVTGSDALTGNYSLQHESGTNLYSEYESGLAYYPTPGDGSTPGDVISVYFDTDADDIIFDVDIAIENNYDDYYNIRGAVDEENWFIRKITDGSWDEIYDGDQDLTGSPPWEIEIEWQEDENGVVDLTARLWHLNSDLSRSSVNSTAVAEEDSYQPPNGRDIALGTSRDTGIFDSFRKIGTVG